MPSKSKKLSKAASSSSSPSVTSSPSPYKTPNPDTELKADDFFGALDEASRKFPSLISKSAFIGKVSNDTSAVASVLHVLDSKGCKIWLSESAMLSSSIAPGSIVSVSLASRKLSSSKPLCSLAEECAISFGFDCLENLVEAAGSYFALATVYPSNKLMKNAVCLSPSLLLTMGCPASGRIVFVHPVHSQPIIGTLNGYDKLEEVICCSVSLNNCKELHLSLVSSQGKFIMNGPVSSYIGLLGDIKNIQDENGNIASPQAPSFSQARINSSRTSLLHTPNFQGSRSYLSHVEEKSTETINISEIFGDDNVRKLLQSCCASWLFSRYLLLGNFVVIPILSRLCIFLAIRGNSLPTTGDFQNQTDKSNDNLISCSPDLINCVNDAFLINHETKVYILSSRDSVTQAPTGEASLSMAPVHGDSRTKKGITFPKLGALSKELAILKDIIVASAVKDDLARFS